VQEPAELAQVRAAYERSAADAAVRKRAGVELYEAEQALDRAEATWREEGNYDESVHLAYLASRKVEIARVASERRALEEEIAALPGQSALLVRPRRSRAEATGCISRRTVGKVWRDCSRSWTRSRRSEAW
jgi:hypothetical protein